VGKNLVSEMRSSGGDTDECFGDVEGFGVGVELSIEIMG